MVLKQIIIKLQQITEAHSPLKGEEGCERKCQKNGREERCFLPSPVNKASRLFFPFAKYLGKSGSLKRREWPYFLMNACASGWLFIKIYHKFKFRVIRKTS